MRLQTHQKNYACCRTTSIVKYVLRTFVTHVSIAKPLGESGKLQLTSDMTELEFTLNAFMAEHGQLDVIGDDYRALRALRQVLIFALHLRVPY